MLVIIPHGQTQGSAMRGTRMIKIDEKLEIPDTEIRLTFSSSSKPGGQNVNRVNTRVTLQFDVGASSALDDNQKRLIMEKLPGRINKQGILRVHSQKFRTQNANRSAAIERFAELILQALHVDPPRKKLRTPGFVKQRRLTEKKRRGMLKRNRSRPLPNDQN